MLVVGAPDPDLEAGVYIHKDLVPVFLSYCKNDEFRLNDFY